MKISDFKGTLPRLPVKKLPPNGAVSAVNCNLATGQLKALKDVSYVQDIDKAGDIRTIYKCGNTWLAWGNEVHVVEAEGVLNDTIYFTGDGYPKSTDAGRAITGGGPSQYPVNTSRMGVPAPAAAPTIQTDEITSGQGYGQMYATVSYCYTLVSRVTGDYLEESAPSPPTPVIDVQENMKVSLTGFSVDAIPGCDLAFIRVYRAVAGSSGDTVYQLVPHGRDGNGQYLYDIPVTQNIFVDMDQESEPKRIYMNLSEAIQTAGWDVLPEDASHLVQYQNGILAAISGQRVLVSELFTPYAFPQGKNDGDIKYSYDFAFKPVAIAAYREMLIVGTNANPFVLTGSEPAYLSKQELAYHQACLGDMCVTETGVFYPGKDGLVLCDGVTAKPVSTDTWTKEQWRELGPENLKLVYYDDRILGFFRGSSVGFIFDFKHSNTVTTFSLGARTFHDSHFVEKEGKLYLLLKDGGIYYIYEWEGSADDMGYSWQGYEYGNDRPLYSLIRVDGDFNGQSLTLTLSVDSRVLPSIEIKNDEPYYLPSGYRLRHFNYMLTGSVVVDSVYFENIRGELYG